MKLCCTVAKLVWVATSLATAAAGLAPGAGLADYKTVYVLPMASGLDQFVAIKLTTGSVMQVVTDPRKADVVLTDAIGAAFEGKLDELYGQKSKSDDKDGKNGKDSMNGSSRISPASRGKGAIFLVDRKTRDVVWSTYVKPGGSAPDDLNRIAGEIASKLDKDRKGK
jgi:hypothetical protein